MSKRWLLLLGLVVLGYLASDYTAARLEGRLVEPVSPTPVRAPVRATPVVTPSSTSTPVAVTPSPHPSVKSSPTPPPLPKLVGTVAGSGHSLAVLEWGADTQVVPVGETLGGCQVMEVNPYSVRIKDTQGRLHLLQLGNSSATPTPALSPSPLAKESPTPTASPLVVATPPRDQTLGTAQLREMLDQPSQAKMTPFRRGDEVVGMQVFYYTSDNPLAKLGIRSGDVLLNVNGQSLKTPDDVAECYRKLRNEAILDFDVDRQGQRFSFTVHLRED